MDARLVWDTWRRILTDDRLVECVLSDGTGADGVGLSQAECAIVDEYARTLPATDSNIGMYRRGLARNALGALCLVPLTQQLVYTRGLDVETLATEYAKADGYRDHGPNFWTNAAGFVAYLGGRVEFDEPAYRDVLALDMATIQIALRLGRSPDPLHRRETSADGSAPRFVASRAAAVVPSSHDLTEWIVNPQSFDPDDTLPPTAHSWLVYFPPDGEPHGYAELSPRAASIFNLLGIARSAREVSAAMGNLSMAETLQVVGSLVERGVVCEFPGDRALSTDVAPAGATPRDRARCDVA